MAKPVKSQWDFGELFPPQETVAPRRIILSVSELTLQVRRSLEQEFGQVWVTGEVSNLRVQSSGHIYFSLKDAGAQLSCVLFRGETPVDRSVLQDGRKVTLGGGLTVYDVRGQYQLRVTKVELQGIGALQAAFERLKQKLKAEGLFAQERKRALPRFPRRIGLVTSPTGAAIRDVLHVISRRNPTLEIILAPCRVQGDGAAVEIAASIRLLNAFNERETRRLVDLPAAPEVATGESQPSQQKLSFLDLILVTRGGGSLEDLWAFNEEVVARAIFHSVVPVVSAVGHEIDFTISDFAADVRAATPSAAAEIITEGVFSSCQFVSEAAERIRWLARRQLSEKIDWLTQTGQRLSRLHPRRRFDDWLQRLDDLQASMPRCVNRAVRHHTIAWRNLADRLTRLRPRLLLKQRREVFHQAELRFREQAHHRLRELKNKLDGLESRLRLLAPEHVLARGYSITFDAETGEVLRRAEAAKPGKRLKTRLSSGEVRSRVED
jgi:exodeoxyribonuclease VII large subunit